MKNQEWNSEADEYMKLLTTDTADIHFGVGIPGNKELGIIPHSKNKFGRALDVGCGSGENSIALAALGYSVVGIDASERQIILAESLADNIKEINKPFFFTLPAERVEDIEGSFDIIMSVGVMHFCSDLKSVIRNVASKLSLGGKFILSLPHPIDMLSNYKELEKNVEITFGSYFPSGQLLQGSRYWAKFGGAEPSGYSFNEYVYTISDVINALIAEGLKLDAFMEPICDHKESYPCLFRNPSKHFILYHSARVPQYAIFIASKSA